MIALYGSGDQSGCVANLITSSPSVSQCGASRSKMTTPTFKSPASSIVPSVNVTWSGLPVSFPKMGLPHVGQNTFVTTDCWADVYSISRMAPETVTASAANIAPDRMPRAAQPATFVTMTLRDDDGRTVRRVSDLAAKARTAKFLFHA